VKFAKAPCLLGVSWLFLAAPAKANGAFPEVSQLVADPSDRTHLILRSNFGLLTTNDTGQNWDLICEAGIGYQNIEPPVALLDDGTTIAALASGIAQADARSCNFTLASGANAYIADVSRIPGSNGHAVAVSSDLTAYVAQVWQSSDSGATWTALGTPLTNLNAATLDVAADDANIVYVSGSSQDDAPNGVLARSADGGQTWTTYTVPGTNKVSAPYIGAVSPSDHQTVYVRLSGTPGQLYVTHDGGAHFELALSFNGPFDGFALSPDERFTLASGRSDGVWRADTSTLAFEHLSCAKIRSLSWSESGLFASADEFEAGFLVGQSSNQGLTFDPLLHLSCLRGPLDCAASTSVGSVCPEAWPAISEQLGTDCASAGSFVPSTQCRDAGAPDSDASSSTDAGDGEPPSTITSLQRNALRPHGGCSCRIDSTARTPASWLWLIPLGLCGARHLRRKKPVVTQDRTRRVA
jgi:photosystem II stability/assembly factor-like uncharacterized protein